MFRYLLRASTVAGKDAVSEETIWVSTGEE